MSHLPTLVPWLWVSTVILGSCVLELLWHGVVVLRAVDLRYDAAACAARRPRVDLGKALSRRVTWPTLGLPMLLLCVVLFAAELVWLGWSAYAYLSIVWFVTAPLRTMWRITVWRRVHNRNGRPRPESYWQDLRRYYASGLLLGRRPHQQDWFIGRLRWLNAFQRVSWLLQVYRYWGICAIAVMSLVWPVTAAFAVFSYLDKDILDDRPWWLFSSPDAVRA